MNDPGRARLRGFGLIVLGYLVLMIAVLRGFGVAVLALAGSNDAGFPLLDIFVTGAVLAGCILLIRRGFAVVRASLRESQEQDVTH